MQILKSQIIGEGRPLIILHGFLGMADNWRSQSTKLAENGFCVHLLDQRNHGHSFHSDAFSYPLLAEDLKNYLEHHNLLKINLLGHSMGGKTAMLFASKYPQFVEKLIVADIAPKYYPIHHQTIIQALQSVDFNLFNTRNEIDTHLSQYISDMPTRQFLLKNIFWETPSKMAFRFNLKALADNLEEIGQALPKEFSFEGKTLFIKGEKSSYITQDDETQIALQFKNATIEQVSRAGHWLHAENPTEFLQKILTFLN